jgi:hypothetical protein
MEDERLYCSMGMAKTLWKKAQRKLKTSIYFLNFGLVLTHGREAQKTRYGAY